MRAAFTKIVALSLSWALAAPSLAVQPAAGATKFNASFENAGRAAENTGGATENTRVRLSLLNTSGVKTLESLTVKGGDWLRTVGVNHIAVLVEHGGDRFLFDTGLGRQVDAQFQQDMPWFYKPFFAYDKVTPARDQLQAQGLEINRIILSHAHWDHASALVDFPEAEVWTTARERQFMERSEPPAVFPSQVGGDGIRWHLLEWPQQVYRSYERSLDLYGDGSVVLVPLEGHTPGGIGMFVKVSGGREFFFIGDTAWRLRGIQERAPKFWYSRRLVDLDPDQTLRDIERIADLHDQNADLTIVPAHDRSVHEPLGYFPHWIE